jgi:hypothetical protein
MCRSTAVQNSRKQIIFFNILYPSMPGFLSRLFKPEAGAELVPLCESFSHKDTLGTLYYVRRGADLYPQFRGAKNRWSHPCAGHAPSEARLRFAQQKYLITGDENSIF